MPSLRRAQGAQIARRTAFPVPPLGLPRSRRGEDSLRRFSCAAFLTAFVGPSAFVRPLAPTLFRPRIADFLTAAPLPPFCRNRVFPAAHAAPARAEPPRRILLRRPKRSAKFPRMSARQQGRPAFRRRSAPSPDLLHRVAPQTRFPETCPNTFPLRRPKAATKASPALNNAPRRKSAEQ